MKLLTYLVLIKVFKILSFISSRLWISSNSNYLFSFILIEYLLMLVYFDNTMADFFEKMLIKSEFLFRIITFSICNKII